jgi:hypothetical protein
VEILTTFWLETLKGRNHLEDLGINGKMSKQISSSIIGKTALTEPLPSLEDFSRFV